MATSYPLPCPHCGKVIDSMDSPGPDSRPALPLWRDPVTARRFNTSPTVTPARTGGDDRPRGACYGLAESVAPDPTCFDLLIEYGPTVTTRYALPEAKALCGSCELRPACHAENWDEPWMLAMRGVPVPRHHKGAVA